MYGDRRQLAITVQLFGRLQFRHVRRVPIHIDDARVNVAGLRKLEKAFRRNSITIWREQEVDGVASRVDGSV